MKKAILYLLLFVVTPQLSAQEFSRVSLLFNPSDITVLDHLGIETDHGVVIPGNMITTDIPTADIALLREKGIFVKILIPDVKKHYAQQNTHPFLPQVPDFQNCGSAVMPFQAPFITPENYSAGSMGGYPTYEEMIAILDDMHAKFPHLITSKATISDSLLTHEGRPVYWWRISDNPDSEEGEPEALFTALHHAREPVGLTQTLFFMWYLLENYETATEIKYLVDHTALYFVPCINPDGYILNQNTDPMGGGLWRKNLRPSGNNTFGVDLNRNYGYQWGFNNQGSSDQPQAGTYRGPSAFSEPETQMIRDFCRTHDFKIVLNYHSFGNLLIYPWAYSDAVADPFFPVLGQALVSTNKFKPGTTSQTVGYPVNGSSDDWVFAELGGYSFTPESGPGSFGFWPAADTIDGLNKVTMHTNLIAGWSLLQYAVSKDLSEPEIYSEVFSIPIEIRRIGLSDGPFTVKLTPLSPLVSLTSGTSFTVELPIAALDTLLFSGQVAGSAASGDLIDFEISIDNGGFIVRDTIQKIFTGGPRIELYTDDFSNSTSWTGDWQLTTEDFVSPPNCLTDSPNEPYFNNSSKTTTLVNAIQIPDAPFPTLQFFAKWSVEANYDWVQIEAIDPNNNAYPLCGLYSHFGGTGQPQGVPLWDGQQENWVKESIDLSAFKGQLIKIRCVLNTDNELILDGFYLDDLVISYVDTTASSQNEMVLPALKMSVLPNPASNRIALNWADLDTHFGAYTLQLTDANGKIIQSMPLPAKESGQLDLPISTLPEGWYTWSVKNARQVIRSGAFLITR